MNYSDSITHERFKRDAYLSKLDIERKEALSKQDGLSYSNKCEALGIEPEDIFLYEQGMADIIYTKRKNHSNIYSVQ